MTHEEIVEELWAREQIRDCLYRYSRGIDRCDIELVRSCYHPDATDDHGAYSGDVDGFIEFVRQSRGPDSPFEVMQHAICHVLIERSGDIAHVESYLYNPVSPRDPSSGVPDLLIGGRFLDRFECRDGRWAIAERRLVFDYCRIGPPTEKVWQQWPEADVLLGRSGRDDPVYHRRG